MKKFFVIFFFIILSISNISIANAEIAFIDMEKILTNSKAGKSVLNQLEALNKKTR
jgi:Skp family chaperone for outer membrane proteins